MTTFQFWVDGEQYAIDGDPWDEINARWPDGVRKPNPKVAGEIVREIAEEAEEGER